MGNFVDGRRDPRLSRVSQQRGLFNTINEYSPRQASLGLHSSDLSERLRRDHATEVTYVRGVGVQVNRVEEPDNDRPVIPRRKLDDQVFFLETLINERRSLGKGRLSWHRDLDHFEIQVEDGSMLMICAADVKAISYNLQIARFLFLAKDSSLEAMPSEPIIEISGCLEISYVFRSLLETRFLSTSVNKVAQSTILGRVSSYRRFHEQPLRPGLQPSGQVDLNIASHHGVETIYKSTSEERQQVSPKASPTSVTRSVSETEDQESDEQGLDGDHAAEKGDQGYQAPESLSRTVRTPEPSSPVLLRYKSGETVQVDQLVVRIREFEMHKGQFKFDKFDLWDGPFRVCEVPSAAVAPSPMFGSSPGSDSVPESPVSPRNPGKA